MKTKGCRSLGTLKRVLVAAVAATRKLPVFMPVLKPHLPTWEAW